MSCVGEVGDVCVGEVVLSCVGQVGDVLCRGGG